MSLAAVDGLVETPPQQQRTAPCHLTLNSLYPATATLAAVSSAIQAAAWFHLQTTEACHTSFDVIVEELETQLAERNVTFVPNEIRNPHFVSQCPLEGSYLTVSTLSAALFPAVAITATTCSYFSRAGAFDRHRRTAPTAERIRARRRPVVISQAIAGAAGLAGFVSTIGYNQLLNGAVCKHTLRTFLSSIVTEIAKATPDLAKPLNELKGDAGKNAAWTVCNSPEFRTVQYLNLSYVIFMAGLLAVSLGSTAILFLDNQSKVQEASSSPGDVELEE
jgi:hypothetical protein